MTTEEYKQLEMLLGKLSGVLNARFCIIPGYVHDGPYIGVYDDDGRIAKQQTGINIESVVSILTNTHG